MRLRVCTALVAIVIVLGSTVTARTPQDGALAAARDLYTSAAYEDALRSLDRLAESPAATDRERATIDHYRALCLLALNRPDEAISAVEAMVKRDPLYAPPQDDLSPRTRQMFQQVQRRVLPAVAQEQYARAKAAHEEGRAGDAVAEFDRVLEILDVMRAWPDPPPLMADLRVLATGFRQFAWIAANPVAEPVAKPSADASSQGVRAPDGPAATPPRPMTVTPPVTVRQDVPPWPHDIPFPEPAVAVVEVVIGPQGRVQQARMQKPLHPRYDQLLLAAARHWSYRPALRDGQPTPFVKAVRVELVRTR
jgi:TonB family protein